MRERLETEDDVAVVLLPLHGDFELRQPFEDVRSGFFLCLAFLRQHPRDQIFAGLRNVACLLCVEHSRSRDVAVALVGVAFRGIESQVHFSTSSRSRIARSVLKKILPVSWSGKCVVLSRSITGPFTSDKWNWIPRRSRSSLTRWSIARPLVSMKLTALQTSSTCSRPLVCVAISINRRSTSCALAK